jgi:hypothetical protein
VFHLRNYWSHFGTTLKVIKRTLSSPLSCIITPLDMKFKSTFSFKPKNAHRLTIDGPWNTQLVRHFSMCLIFNEMQRKFISLCTLYLQRDLLCNNRFVAPINKHQNHWSMQNFKEVIWKMRVYVSAPVLSFLGVTMVTDRHQLSANCRLSGHGLFKHTDQAFACCNDQRRKLQSSENSGPHR